MQRRGKGCKTARCGGGRGGHPHARLHRAPACSVLSGRGEGRARLALGETHLCGEGSRANRETGPGREGCLPV